MPLSWFQQLKGYTREHLQLVTQIIWQYVQTVWQYLKRYRSAILAVLCFLSYVRGNLFSMELGSLKGTVLNRYNAYPSFMHTGDPAQILGLPARVDVSLMPSLTDTKRALQKYKARWHPDKITNNGLESQEIAHEVIMIGKLSPV